jgi:two-component system chemotaxis response regulator CheB
MSVLIVDDSAVVREALTAILTRDGTMAVAVASDPILAMKKMELSRPDVVILDLEMPRMDGLTFLKHIMATDPVPVVVCSALSGARSDVALRALAEGAVDIIEKPTVGLRGFLHESAILLIETVRGAGAARVGAKTRGPRKSSALEPAPAERAPLRVTTNKVIAVGASTGGTEALRVLLEAMPADCPGIIIVQHMPALFTRTFAEHLGHSCQIEVREAAAGDRIVRGRALIAPGDRHVAIRRNGAFYEVVLDGGPLVSRHRPSVDVLFSSVASAAGVNAVGVILTGMGSDGATGLSEMRRAGARTIAQDEATCVVFGMPREAILRGAADEVLPLPLIAGAILTAANRNPASA